jgi:hypothetical protein
MTNEISHMVLHRLPTVTISPRRRPQTFTVIFRVPWEPILQHIDQDRGASDCPMTLGNLITLTGSCDNNMQACTVNQYFEQAFPKDEPSFLESLKSLVEPANWPPLLSGKKSWFDRK